MLAMVRVLTERGHEVEVVTALPNHLRGQIFEAYRGKFYVQETRAGAKVHRTWVYASPDKRVSKRLLNYASFVGTSLAGLSRVGRADYLFVQSPPLFLSLPAALFSSLRQTPIILDVADLWPKSVKLLGVMRQGVALRAAENLERWAYRRARFVNAATQGIYQELAGQRDLKNKVLFLPNGVDTSLFHPREPDEELLHRHGLHGKKVFIYAGTHGLAYRLDLLVNIALELAPLDVVFMLVGDGHSKQSLAKLVADSGANNILLVDSQPEDELPRYYSLAHASVVPLAKNKLFEETRPAKIFSSLASGVPVIYSGHGEGARLIEESQAGIVVPPEDSVALTEAIRTVVLNNTLHRDLSEKARQYAVSHFDWRQIIGSWVSELLERDCTFPGSLRGVAT